ncbi:hybrid sensor histidine kinase/response regulator [Geomonas azotofigens]|uniref:hybrid sensor histidine kinase/response regulator n=1 Tax=Geomonas azotofigens TaxID=2843196 RepID=UPI001C0F6076|nr:PAS domain-containing sensor histidine kinase [Geomonas azotofigens]MBU5615308.1 response regulator [Geomonas azotofigens]
MKERESRDFSPAAQLMAVEVISELLVSSSPRELGAVLTEHLRELTGARTVIVLLHDETRSPMHEVLTVSPQRRASLFTPEELELFCCKRFPEQLPLTPDQFDERHPLYAPLHRAGIRSLMRCRLVAAGETIGLLLLFDLHALQRIEEVNQIISLLSPPIALALKNAVAFRVIEQQALALERRVEERTAELSEAQALLQVAVDSSPYPIMICDEEGRVLQLSAGWTRLSGYAMSEIATLEQWAAAAFGERSTDTMEYLRGLFAIEKTEYNGEWSFRARDGSTRTWDFQTTPLGRVSKGKRVLLVMATDVTERKKAEEEKKRLEEQLIQAQKLESVGRLAGGVAHDFNNMLSVILGHANLALMDLPPGDRLQAGLEEIRKAAERSANLTRQLLAFARKQTVCPKVLDLNETVGHMLSMLQRLIGERIELVWKPGAKLWHVLVDPSQVDQILANLCVNARDSIPEMGSIVIETANCVVDGMHSAGRGIHPGDFVRISIGDTGCGMEPEILAHAFEPFFTTKEVGAGTGLGLATVYGVARQNGGWVDVESKVGGGTTVTVYLPRHQDEQLQEPLPSPEPPSSGEETILLVEDESAILNIVTMMLGKQGYHVLPSTSPEEAMKLARTHPGKISLLITDVIMPGMNGHELAGLLQAENPELRCLFISGYTADLIAQHGVLEDGVHFIQKPFSIPELAAKVREALA